MARKVGGSLGFGGGQLCSWTPQTADSEPRKGQRFQPGVSHHSQHEATELERGWRSNVGLSQLGLYTELSETIERPLFFCV